MNWIHINNEDIIEQIKKESFIKKVLIFKYSPRCSINMVMRNMLEREWNCGEMDTIKTYFLNIIVHRNISDLIESEFGITHESPQVLIIENGESIFNASHGRVRYENLRSFLKCEQENKINK